MLRFCHQIINFIKKYNNDISQLSIKLLQLENIQLKINNLKQLELNFNTSHTKLIILFNLIMEKPTIYDNRSLKVQQFVERAKKNNQMQKSRQSNLTIKKDDRNSKRTSQTQIALNNRVNIQCGIEEKYLNPLNYHNTCEYAKKPNILYRNLCIILQSYYVEWNKLDLNVKQKISKASHQKNQSQMFIKQFKSFLSEFFNTFHQVSLVHIDYFNQISFGFNKKQQIIEQNTQQMIEKIKIYEKSQKQFQESSKNYDIKLNQIYFCYQRLKKEEKQPLSYFNKKYFMKKAKQLLQNLQKQQKIRQNLAKDLNQVYDHSAQFQNDLLLYRQTLFSNKYNVMKKLIDMARNSKNALVELLVYLCDCINKRNNQFIKYSKDKSNDIKKRKKSRQLSNIDDKMAIETYLVQTTNDYNGILGNIQQILISVSDAFQSFRKFTNKQAEQTQKVIQTLNLFYDADESPAKQIFQALQFYTYFCKKICELDSSINIATNQFAKLRTQTIKLSKITLSLVKNTKAANQKSFQNHHADQTGHCSQIQILLQKMSYDYPINFLQKIYKHFQESLSFLKNYASSKINKKKKIVEDSMDISHFQETIIKPQKRPGKKQIWLWEKWQNSSKYTIDQLKVENLKVIKQFIIPFMEEFPEAIQIDRCSCSLQTTGQPSGFLILTSKYIKFQTSQGICLLIIQNSAIEDAKIIVRMFGKVIQINTIKGTIYFKGFIDIQSVIQIIEQARSRSTGKMCLRPPRQVIQISSEELAKIEERKIQIKNQLPKIQDFQLHTETIFQDITIDHVYELIFSDKQVTIKGKTQPIFFAYCMKKSGASNYQLTKYDSLGPKFYTQEEGVNFANCPLFSTRIINYDVKLPPIPFMPKYAQNRQQSKLFWISNEQFQYLIHINTSGAPKSDTFYIQILHKLQKINKNVKYQLYWRIFFTQDSYLKGTLKSNASQQTKRQLTATIQQIRRYVNQSNSKVLSNQSKIHSEIQQQQIVQKQGSLNSNNTLKVLIKIFLSLFKQPKFKQGSNKNNTNSIIGIIIIAALLLNLLLSIFG